MGTGWKLTPSFWHLLTSSESSLLPPKAMAAQEAQPEQAGGGWFPGAKESHPLRMGGTLFCRRCFGAHVQSAKSRGCCRAWVGGFGQMKHGISVFSQDRDEKKP